jgi:alpha-L-fucosidase 2
METTMNKFLSLLLAGFLLISCSETGQRLETSPHDLVFSKLAGTWDEGVPIGNGMLGALVWKKGENLRISLDRADLWDLRPMQNMYREGFNYGWVHEQWKKDNYQAVQGMFDRPYDESAGPSKIPAAALEISSGEFGPVHSVRLFVHQGICRIDWQNGMSMDIFLDPEKPVGWFAIKGNSKNLEIKLVPPNYDSESTAVNKVTGGKDLRLLGYPAGELAETQNTLDYVQEGWEGFMYRVHCKLERSGNRLLGCWSISSHYPDREPAINASATVEEAWNRGYKASLQDLITWWDAYWSRSSVSLPDTVLEKQWYMEMYKFGAAARRGAPPISLQAIWTADNGRLPPWNGDFHHDLNTQLSYWPAYSGNHLDLEEGFLDWLWMVREEGKKYSRWFYGAEGLNIPGVTTLRGAPMGGWIQYSCGPTVSAWLAQHFYLHWRYSQDETFLRERAYPWLKDVALFLDQIAVKNEAGKRKLPLSSSPEIYNNSREAWFGETTNFDLSLIRFVYTKAAELADELGLAAEAERWRSILSEWPDLTVDHVTGLMFAPGFPYDESHRHFSHLMGFHPLGLVDWENGEKDREIIVNTLRNLEKQGTDWWCGYSFSWMGNLYARAREGDNAAEILRTFATCFTLPNSFHVNGDQSGTGLSKFTYRPFTLEGNFAFAAGIQEMLLQSHTGITRVFPAIPDSWKEVGFRKMRTEGAFLVSAERAEGQTAKVTVEAEKSGSISLEDPFDGRPFTISGKPADDALAGQKIIELDMDPGQVVILEGR